MQRDEEEEDVLMNDVPIFDTERPHTQVTANKFTRTHEGGQIEKFVLLSKKSHVVNPKTREISQYLDTSYIPYGSIPKENPVRQNVKSMLQNQKGKTADTYDDTVNRDQNRYYQNILENIDEPRSRTTKISDWKVEEGTSLRPAFLEKSFRK